MVMLDLAPLPEDVQVLVLAGGPDGGKTESITEVMSVYGDQVEVIHEMATMLLSNGFPVPGVDLEWSYEWQDLFETVIYAGQSAYEGAVALKCKQTGKRLIVTDRGLLDGAGYEKGGMSEFLGKVRQPLDVILERYTRVIFLQSLASYSPEMYSQAGNRCRFEPPDRAAFIDGKLKEAWAVHPAFTFRSAGHGIEKNKEFVLDTVREMLFV